MQRSELEEEVCRNYYVVQAFDAASAMSAYSSEASNLLTVHAVYLPLVMRSPAVRQRTRRISTHESAHQHPDTDKQQGKGGRIRDSAASDEGRPNGMPR
jgi:hypothetical protein